MKSKICPMCNEVRYESFYFYGSTAICPFCYMRLSIAQLENKGENK